MTNNQQRLWLWPLIAMALITPFTPWLDLAISHHFFHNAHFSENAFCTFIYTYGLLPAQLAFVAACLFFLLSYLLKSWKPGRKMALVAILTMAIGSGLITNVILKDHWGRPRPKQTTEFLGQQQFRPYYIPNFSDQPEPSRAFPCGHCSTGFFFFAFTLMGIRTHNKPLTWISLAIAIALGGTLGITRIAQGGHFFSDVLASALVMWITAYVCAFSLLDEPPLPKPTR